MRDRNHSSTTPWYGITGGEVQPLNEVDLGEGEVELVGDECHLLRLLAD